MNNLCCRIRFQVLQSGTTGPQPGHLRGAVATAHGHSSEHCLQMCMALLMVMLHRACPLDCMPFGLRRVLHDFKPRTLPASLQLGW